MRRGICPRVPGASSVHMGCVAEGSHTLSLGLSFSRGLDRGLSCSHIADPASSLELSL